MDRFGSNDKCRSGSKLRDFLPNRKATCTSQDDDDLLTLVVMDRGRGSRFYRLHPHFKVLKLIAPRGESLMLQAGQSEYLT